MAFGKAGKSLHGITVLRWDSTTSDYKVLNVRCACDDANQTWFHTLNALRVSVATLQKSWPDVERCDLLSDGAGNYDCTAFYYHSRASSNPWACRSRTMLCLRWGEGRT